MSCILYSLYVTYTDLFLAGYVEVLVKYLKAQTRSSARSRKHYAVRVVILLALGLLRRIETPLRLHYTGLAADYNRYTSFVEQYSSLLHHPSDLVLTLL